MIVSKYVIKSDKVKVPAKLVLMSDFHNRLQYAMPALNLARSFSPDAILVAGDLVDRHRKTYDLAVPFLTDCVNIAPTFFAYGNHEVQLGRLQAHDFERSGATVLCNQVAEFTTKAGDKYAIGGQLPFATTEWVKELEERDAFRILLCHRPESYIKNFVGCEVDLAVSGHAHGGQIRIREQGLFSPDQGVFPKYTKGQYGKMIVTTGIANTGGIVPRLGNPEEIVLIMVMPKTP